MMTNSSHAMRENKFQRFAVLGLLYINLGRPQDVLPLVKFIHPGMIFGVLVLCSFYTSEKVSDGFKDEIFQEKKWFIALWTMMLISTLSSIYLRASVEFIMEYFKVVVLLFGLLAVLKSEHDFTCLAIVFLASVLTLCLPIAWHGMQSDRVSIGTFYDPNDLAMFVGCSIPFTLYLIHIHKTWLKIFALGGLALGIIAVILTQSRMGFLALILNALFYLAFSFTSRPNKGRKIIVIAGVVTVFMLFAGDIYWNRIKTTTDKGQTGSGRTIVWNRSLKIVAKYPVLGAGPGTFTSAYGRMLKAGDFEAIGNEYDRAWKAAHNSYLIVAAELGLAGVFFFLMIIRTTLGRLSQVRKLCKSQEDKAHIVILANVTLASLGVFFFCAVFLSQAYSSLFITLVACSVLVRRINIDNDLMPETGVQVSS